MPDDISDIVEMYNRDPGREDTRLEEHQLEFDLTLRYLEKYLPLEGRILELGAATGRYTLELARRGYHVTAVDISESLLERCQERLARAGYAHLVEYVLADGRDLHQIPGLFDAGLVMGPLYHLVLEEDRKAVLGQVIQRLKPGGIIFSAFISRFGILGDLLKTLTWWIEKDEEVRSLLEKGRDSDQWPKGGFRGYFATVAEIAPLHEAIGFETLIVAGVEPAISADDESYNRLDGDQRRLWLDLLFEISAVESMVGASRHLLYVGKKTGG